MLDRRSSWTALVSILLLVPCFLNGDPFPKRASRAVSEIQETDRIVSQAYLTEIEKARAEVRMMCEWGHQASGNTTSLDGKARPCPPGVSVAVAINGAIVWAEGSGLADVEQTVPVVKGSKFRIGSTSKSFTAVAAILLSERGKLDLDGLWECKIRLLTTTKGSFHIVGASIK